MSDLPRPDQSALLRVDLVATVGQLGAVVLAPETIETVIELVTELAVTTIPGTDGAGVTLVDDHGKRSLAPSTALVEQADALQYAFDSGPCLTAWHDQITVRIDDVSAETAWPEWCAAAAALGIRSVLSVPLAVEGTSVGAMKVYAKRPDAYDAHAEQTLQLFAQQAAILLVNIRTLADARRLSADLRNALTDRDIVGQAKGVLMAQGAVDEQAAFTQLVSASQRSHERLAEVARQLVETVRRRNQSP